MATAQQLASDVHGDEREIRRQRHAAKVRFVDTVCKPTKDRQDALRRLIAETEIIVVVGGHASNNTRQLVEACRATGRRAIHVECAEELAPEVSERTRQAMIRAGEKLLKKVPVEVEVEVSREWKK